MKNATAIILSGGLGSRLRPFTEVIPKPLLPIGEKAVLEIQIEKLQSYGFNHIYLATNYKSDYVESFFGDGSRYGVKLEISKEDKPLGTAGPIKLLENKLINGNPFIVMNGDILSMVNFSDLYQYAQSKEGLLTVTVKKIVLPYAFGNIISEGDRVVAIEEKPDFITYALAGIYVLKPEILELIPRDEYFGMDKLIKKMLSENMPIHKYEINEYWLDIGSMTDYEAAQDAYKMLYEE
jgi:NDP-sugar pyrophosphorylase family protein